MSELRTNKIVPRDGIPTATSGTRNGGGIVQVVTCIQKDAQTISGAGGGSAGVDVDYGLRLYNKTIFIIKSHLLLGFAYITLC